MIKAEKIIRKCSMVLIFTSLCCNITSCNNILKSQNKDNSALESNSFYNVSQKENDIILNFAVLGEDSILKQAAEKFNEADNGYCVNFIEYTQQGYGEVNSSELNLLDMDLIQKIINSNDIDIVSSYSFQNEDNYRMLQEKGAFVDLNLFMENDEEINKSSLNNHVLSAAEIDGKLYTLPTFFTVYTMGGIPEYVGNKQNWTYDEMITYWEKMPPNATINGKRTKEEAFNTFLAHNLTAFIDYKKCKTYFDSQEFRRCLEFCNTFKYEYQEKTDYDYDAPQFVNYLSIDSFMGTWPYELGSDSPKLTLVGFPSSDGKGAFFRSCGNCFSISYKSSPEKQKGAWEFIRTFVTEEWQLENGLSSDDENLKTEMGFCLNNKAFYTIKDNVANKKYADEYYQDKGESFETIFPSKEDCDKLTEYINSIDRWEVNINDSVDRLIYEEIMMYFSGESTLDECVNNIQSRASLWISEQFD